MKVVAVIFGGKSVEHDISIITAMHVLSKLPKDYIAFPIYITQEERFVTADNIDKAETFLDFNKKVKNLRDVSFDFKRKCFNSWVLRCKRNNNFIFNQNNNKERSF